MKPVIPFTTLFLKTSAIFFLTLILPRVIQAQPGTLDSSFGVNGKVVNQMYGEAYCTALQKDGKILAAGLAYEEAIIIVRYNADGSLDNTFGVAGKVLTDIYAEWNIFYTQALAMAVQGDGKIVITGYGIRDVGMYGDYDIILARYNTDGTLDAGFGNNGIVINDFYGTDEYAAALAIQPDGKIVIGGTSSALLIARYNTDGSPDLTFGGTGWIKKYNTGGVASIALQPDGKIVAAGTSTSGGDRFVVSRIDADGKVDSTFGSNGSVFTDFGPGGDQLNSIALQPDGKIVGVGKTGGAVGQDGSFALIRYLSNGSIDTSFGIAGKVITEIPGRFSEAHKILLANGKIYVAGSAFDFAIAHYNKDGSLNDHFGNAGTQITDMGGGDRGYDALLQPDGKIIVIGTSYDTPTENNFAIVRYNGEHQTDPQFAKIKKWLHKHGFTWDDFPHLAPGGSIHIERSANGSIYNTIASIAAHNNNQPYSFEDPAPLAGTNYYKLTATAADGSNVSSNVIAIGSSDAASVKVFPNPVKNSLQVTGLSATQKTTLSITDLSGAGRAAVTVTGSSYNWNIGQLKAGSYILRIENGVLIVSKMFVKE